MAGVLFSFAISALGASQAHASPAEVLTSQDVAAYRAAFTAAEQGNFDAADLAVQQIHDPCLLGELRMLRLMHPTAYTAPYTELTSWLRQYNDLPFADRVYNLALRRHLSGDPPPRPLLMVDDSGAVDSISRSGGSGGFRAAREAYYNGDVTRALSLATASGEHWIAGLSAYRLGQFGQSLNEFATVARNPAEDPWLRAAAGFWAARAADGAGTPEMGTELLQIAARFPTTFYGLLAGRRLEMNDDPLGHVVQAAMTVAAQNNPALAHFDVAAMVRAEPRARRAVALMQLGRTQDAALELRAGLALEIGRAHV